MDYYFNDAYYKGLKGENEVARILSTLDTKEYRVINNVLLNKQHIRKGDVPTAQIDHIVVSLYGIFAIETKNYAGKIYGSGRAKSWSVYVGNKRYFMNNPLRQDLGHIRALQDLIFHNSNEWGFSTSKLYFYPIIAFSSRAKLLKLHCENVDVVYYAGVLNAIKSKSRNPLFTFEQMQTIADFIESKNIYSEENIKKHVEDIKRIKGDEKERSWNVLLGSKEPYLDYVLKNESNSNNVKNNRLNNTNNSIYANKSSEKNNPANEEKSIKTVIAVILCIAIILIVTFTLSGCGITVLFALLGKSLLNKANTNAAIEGTAVYESADNIVEKEVPLEKDITKQEYIYSPREDVINEIIYICHGSYQELDTPYVDEDGVSYRRLIQMWCHFAFDDGTYIDINTDSYDKLSFDYIAATHNFATGYNSVTIQVYALSTNQMIYETEEVEAGHTKKAFVDVSNCEKVRLKFVDANNKICYCWVNNIILSK